MQETRIGSLSFNAVDFGARLRLSAAIRDHLACGDQHEINQRTIIHLSASSERVSQKRPKRIPSFSRVAELAKNMREAEIRKAREMATVHVDLDCAIEIMSITHDVLTAYRDRDFRTICLFSVGGITQLGIHDIRIVEVNADSSATIVRNFTIFPVTDESDPVYFIAYRGHMRRMQPSILTGIELWKEWMSNSDCIRDITVMGWVDFPETLNTSDLVAAPCRRCGQVVKISFGSDALFGGPTAFRGRRNPNYAGPPLLGPSGLIPSPNIDVSLAVETEAPEEKRPLPDTNDTVTPNHPPAIRRPSPAEIRSSLNLLLLTRPESEASQPSHLPNGRESQAEPRALQSQTERSRNMEPSESRIDLPVRPEGQSGGFPPHEHPG